MHFVSSDTLGLIFDTQIMKKELEHHCLVQEQNTILLANNKELKNQIEEYSNKFEEYQGNLVKFNEMFGPLKKELELAQKQRLKLMKERDELLKRSEKADKNILLLLEESKTLKSSVSKAVSV
jgi:hypothetical protein